MVAKGGEVFDEAVLGDTAGLFETRHALPNFHIHESIFLNSFEIIFVYNLIGDERDGDAHVFVVWEGGAVIKFGKVNSAEASGRGADGAVDEALDGGDSSA